MDKAKLRKTLTAYAPYFALAILLVICCISSPGFRKPQNLLNITRQVSYSGIIALGMTFIIIGGGIDLSVGSLLAFSGTIGIIAMNHVESPMAGMLLAVAATLFAGLLGGSLNGALINVGKLPPFIATLGTMSIFRSLTLRMTNAGTLSTANEIYGKVGGAVFLKVPLPTIVLFVLTALGSIILLRTRFGRHVCAVGSNVRVAQYAAINTSLVSFCSVMNPGTNSLFLIRVKRLCFTPAAPAYVRNERSSPLAFLSNSYSSSRSGSLVFTFAICAPPSKVDQLGNNCNIHLPEIVVKAFWTNLVTECKKQKLLH